MKATAIAPANIAFIKYWGKKDETFRLPMNTSVSMNLSDAYTITTVEFSQQLHEDSVYFLPREKVTGLTFFSRPLKKSQLTQWRIQDKEQARVVEHLDRIRGISGKREKAMVVSGNSFPSSSGIASSASGFAALTVAGVKALGLTLSEKELTILARLGSGSACRSIPDGFVEWGAGDTSDDSYAFSIFPENQWDLRDIIIVVEPGKKKISSTEGMEKAQTSPFFRARLAAIPERLSRVKTAIQKKDISLLGSVLEEECLDMHQVMQTQIPPLSYWNDTTKKVMDAVVNWRKDGLHVYFTIDAGPNVHLICEAKNEQAVMNKVKIFSGIEELIVNKQAQGARLFETHLF